MKLSGKYYATLGNTEKVMMLQTSNRNRHIWKDMKYKIKRDSNGHVKTRQISEKSIMFATTAKKRAIQDVTAD